MEWARRLQLRQRSVQNNTNTITNTTNKNKNTNTNTNTNNKNTNNKNTNINTNTNTSTTNNARQNDDHRQEIAADYHSPGLVLRLEDLRSKHRNPCTCPTELTQHAANLFPASRFSLKRF